MLGVFDRSTAKQPAELLNTSSPRSTWLKTRHDIAQFYLRWRRDTDTTLYKFPNENFMALSQTNQQLPQPISIVTKEDIHCIFFGTLENAPDLWELYGLSKGSTEAMIMFAAYKMLRDVGTFSPDYVVRELQGTYSFILFDSKFSTVFLARDRQGGVEFHWGSNVDGSLICSDDQQIISGACGDCYTPFPQGCFFLSGYGLISFDHPYHLVKATEHKNENGTPRAIIFQVDLHSRFEIPCCIGGGNGSATASSSHAKKK